MLAGGVSQPAKSFNANILFKANMESISTNSVGNHQNTPNISEKERKRLFLEAAHELRTLNPNDRDQAQILLDRLLAAGACKITFKK